MTLIEKAIEKRNAELEEEKVEQAQYIIEEIEDLTKKKERIAERIEECQEELRKLSVPVITANDVFD